MQKGDRHRGRDSARYSFMQENIEEYANEMTRRHMTYEVLYEDYLKSTDSSYGYTQFKSIIQEYIRHHDYKYHNTYAPGREMQFDFASDNLWTVDRDTVELTRATVLGKATNRHVAILQTAMLIKIIIKMSF